MQSEESEAEEEDEDEDVDDVWDPSNATPLRVRAKRGSGGASRLSQMQRLQVGPLVEDMDTSIIVCQVPVEDY